MQKQKLVVMNLSGKIVFEAVGDQMNLQENGSVVFCRDSKAGTMSGYCMQGGDTFTVAAVDDVVPQ